MRAPFLWRQQLSLARDDAHPPPPALSGVYFAYSLHPTPLARAASMLSAPAGPTGSEEIRRPFRSLSNEQKI